MLLKEPTQSIARRASNARVNSELTCQSCRALKLVFSADVHCGGRDDSSTGGVNSPGEGTKRKNAWFLFSKPEVKQIDSTATTLHIVVFLYILKILKS